MINKKTTALAFIISLVVGLQVSNIYVPDGFESPVKFRLMAVIFKISGLYVNTAIKNKFP